MSNQFEVQSHKGPYRVELVKGALAAAASTLPETAFVIVDETLPGLYESEFQPLLAKRRLMTVPATESAKSLESFPAYVAELTEKGVRRGQPLLAIGGGIIQDITAFLAATMLRGLDWYFVPTTLLAQADSCIGSKSSINCGGVKNILGTFTPPRQVWIDVDFRKTLASPDVRSGIGEMLKAHAIAGLERFAGIANDYDRLLSDDECMSRYVLDSLRIKVPFIEQDEFDLGVRNIFNYGHSFGHAIESALQFRIPHGLAVTLGMDIANFVAWRLGVGAREVFEAMHPTLRRNVEQFSCPPIPFEPFMSSLGKDKKNLGHDLLVLILPDSAGRLDRRQVVRDAAFTDACIEYFHSFLAGTA